MSIKILKPKPDLIIDFLLSLLFILIYFESTNIWQYTKLEDLTNFSAHLPFQYRVLIPSLVNVIHKAFPGLKIFFLYQLILLGFSISLARVSRIYLREYIDNKLIEHFGIILLFYILLWNYCALGVWLYPWDIPSIVFFTIGLICIKQNRMLLFFPLFVIATFNRETIILVILAHIITRDNLRMFFRAIPVSFLYFTVWLFIKYILYLIFIDNPLEPDGGKLFLNKVSENIDFLIALLKFDKFYILRIFSFGGLYFLIPFAIKYLDNFTKRLLILIPVILVIIFMVGKFQEVRIYSELVPIILLPAILKFKKYISDEILKSD